MIMKKIILIVIAFIVVGSALFGCSRSRSSMQDGYFAAEMSDYANGWKEFVTIYVKDNQIISVEYNAKNSSGFIKSWDMAYMRNMNAKKGTYPNRYTREYGKQMIEKQSTENIDAVTGATTSYGTFKQLITAAVDMAKSGKNEMAIVEVNNK